MTGRDHFRRSIQRRRQRGASLLELVIVMSVFLVILYGIYILYETAQTTYAAGAADIELQDNGRRIQEEMPGLVMGAGYDPERAGIFGFQSAGGFTPRATQDTLLFSLDADEDGVLDNNSAERVGFALFGTELKRTMDGINPVAAFPSIARNVQSIRFCYLDAADNEIEDCSNPPYALDGAEMLTIRVINIQVTLSGEAAGLAGRRSREYTFSTDIRPRNL